MNDQTWTESTGGIKKLPAWDSPCGNYRIVNCKSIRTQKPFRLISNIHEDEYGNPKFWDFNTMEEAKDYTAFI